MLFMMRLLIFFFTGLVAVAFTLDSSKDCLAADQVVTLLHTDAAVPLQALSQATSALTGSPFWSNGVSMALASTSRMVTPSGSSHRRYK